MENPAQNFSLEMPQANGNIVPKRLNLYRRRLIPEECIPLPNDVILSCRDGILITFWKTIRPKKNMDHGYSCYFLKEGYKVSKFYRADNSLLYYYCDIISPDYEENTHALTVTDLLADVIIEPDGAVKVVDLAELADAHERGLLSTAQLHAALRTLNRLLELIYAGKLPELLAPIEEFEK